MAHFIEPIVMDIEASGFGAESYPIEVGLALPDNHRRCMLIKPAPTWTHWDIAAQAVHTIPRKSLEENGKPVVLVASELNRLLSNKTVYSDGWVVDEPWIIRLFDAAKINRHFYFHDIQTIMNERQMACWRDIKKHVEAEYGLTRHRASNDAFIVQETYRRSRAEALTLSQ